MSHLLRALLVLVGDRTYHRCRGFAHLVHMNREVEERFFLMNPRARDTLQPPLPDGEHCTWTSVEYVDKTCTCSILYTSKGLGPQNALYG